VLPIRLWQEGALLFAATAPADPDHRLGLLDQGAGRAWQWLPLVGSDFPLSAYAQRGPLVAWTPHLAGVAVKVDRKPAEGAAGPAPWPRWAVALAVALPALLALLVALNLWATFALRGRLAALAPAPPDGQSQPAAAPATTNPAAPADESRERFADAL